MIEPDSLTTEDAALCAGYVTCALCQGWAREAEVTDVQIDVVWHWKPICPDCVAAMEE